MKFIFLLFLILLLFGCNRTEIIIIDYDSKDYSFNSEINYYLQGGDDIGLAARQYSFVSEHEELLKSLEHKTEAIPEMQDSLWDHICSNYHQESAKNHILEKAKSHEILMFNENHNLPRHRQFVKSLLSELYDQGYKHLALEAIGMMGNGNMFDKELADRGYPMLHTGFYLKEPEFALLVREAISLGYNIIGYDEGKGSERESTGAANITRQLNELNQDGKLLVLCGWDHIKEGPSGTYWEYALAERLKQLTGHDPLTINQTAYSERINTSHEEPLMQRLDPKESIVLLDNNDSSIDLSENTDWYDIFVFHPRTEFLDGIPDWIRNESRIEKLSIENITIECPCKVLVFDKNDDIKIASPNYVVEIKSIEDNITIPIRTDAIKLVVTNKKESYLVE